MCAAVCSALQARGITRVAPLAYTAPAQDIEKKLEADVATIGWTILFAVGFITLEFGVNDLIGKGSWARHGCHPGVYMIGVGTVLVGRWVTTVLGTCWAAVR